MAPGDVRGQGDGSESAATGEGEPQGESGCLLCLQMEPLSSSHYTFISADGKIKQIQIRTDLA